MQYTVKSRGVPIGTTDFGFVRIDGWWRSGWFHPNAEGEKVMPVIAAVGPAIRAYVNRDAVPRDEGDVERHADATLLADISAAMDRERALELTLHREDGSLIPTRDIGIRDTEQLIALAEPRIPVVSPLDEPFDEELEAEPDEEIDDELRASIEHDVAIIDAMFADDDLTAGSEWSPEDDEPPNFPRYQIHVELAVRRAIP